MNLYITADNIGIPTGGGSVTYHESEALKELGDCIVYGRNPPMPVPKNGTIPLDADWSNDPWGADKWMMDSSAAMRFAQVKWMDRKQAIAHFYAGCFSDTIVELKRRGVRTVYTAAAHSIDVSKQEHEKLGLQYSYDHLTDPELLKRYLAGYLAADCVVCPSQHSASVMRKLGRVGRIEVIPHGVDLPEHVASLPARFTCGYIGSYGPDKGVRYLLEAWKKLNYSDATLLLAGRDSTSPWVQHLVNTYGGGNISLLGWQENVSDFYNQISLYVQPSVTEGFGLEVIEVMAAGRPVICSTGAGASDLVGSWSLFPPCDSDAIADRIEAWQNITTKEWEAVHQEVVRKRAEQVTWNKIRERYKKLWREYL